MGILERLSRLVRANLNDLIRRAEDPEKIIEQALEDMRATLRTARMEVAEAMAELKRLEREQQNYAEQARAWEQKAAEALKSQREDLAREALKRKQQVHALSHGFAQQVAQQQTLVSQLTTQLKALEGKIQEAEAKKALLLARKKGVEAAEAVRKFGSKVDAHAAVQAFEEMERRIEAMEDKHAALLELDRNDVERALESLGSDREVEEELARLKRELGMA